MFRFRNRILRVKDDVHNCEVYVAILVLLIIGTMGENLVLS